MVLARDSAQLELLLLGILASATLATYIKMSVFPAALPATTAQTESASLVPTLVHPALVMLRLASPAPLVSITIQLREPAMPFPTAHMVRWKFKVFALGFAPPIGISIKLLVSVLVPAASSRMALAAVLSPLPLTSAPSLSSCKAAPVWLSVSLDFTPTQPLAPAWPAHPLAKLASRLTIV